MAVPYQRLQLARGAQAPDAPTAEETFWKRFKFPVHVKQYAAVTSIDFSPTAPHDFAVTSSTRVQIFSPKTKSVKHTISRFKDVAYSGSYRSDGRMLVAGGETGVVQLFELTSRSVLRQFKGHTGAVRVTKFTPTRVDVMSCGDDGTVRRWDVTSEQQTLLLDGHTDVVRAGVVGTSNPDVWVTGSYDHTVKVWDVRVGESVMSLTHGHPVEALLMFPSGGLVVSAGANEIKVWDILGGGGLLHTSSNHQKTITSLCFDGSHSRILSGGLDHQVKVTDVETYKVTHSFSNPAPVLAVALSPDTTHFVTGMANGLLTIRHRVAHQKEVTQAKAANARGGTYRYFIRGKNAKPTNTDFVVESERRKKLKDYDVFLRSFQYSKALDAALSNSNPAVTVSLLAELVHRGGLSIALSNRDESSLEPLLAFLVRNITKPHFASLLVEVADAVFEMYVPIIGTSVVVDELFVALHKKLRKEINFQKEVLGLQGVVEILMAAAMGGSGSAGEVAEGDEGLELLADVAHVGGSGDIDMPASMPASMPAAPAGSSSARVVEMED